MTQDQPPPPAAPVEKIFAEIIAAFLRMIAGREPWIKPVPLTVTMRRLIGAHICYYARRFAAIAVRWRAGTLRRLPRRAARDPDAPDAGPARPGKPSAQDPLTRMRGWVGQATGWQGRGYGGQLVYLIRNNPEMRALLEAAPQLGDVLRPLIRLFYPKNLEAGALPPSRRQPSPRRPRRRAARAITAAAPAPESSATGDAPEPRTARGRLLSPQEVLRRNPWLPHHPKQERARLGLPEKIPKRKRR